MVNTFDSESSSVPAATFGLYYFIESWQNTVTSWKEKRQNVLKHFVVTRFGLGVHYLPWYESTLSLFEAITYPSVSAQTSQNFTWLIVVDRKIPEPALRRLRDIIGDAQNIHIVPLDLTNMWRVRHGCFDHIWDRCQDYILERQVLTDPSDYVVTSAIDADDAWHRDTIRLVHEQSKPELSRFLAGEQSRSAVVRHTCGQVLTFTRGLRWFPEADVVQPLEYEFLSMSVFVLGRFSSGISALSSRHSAWPAMAHALLFETKKARIECPMWVYVRHDRTQVDWRMESSESDLGSAAALQANFGINFAKVAEWRADHALRRGGTQPSHHAGLSGREQHDCYFKITALNRQIALLERKQWQNGSDSDDELLVLRQREARLRLLKCLHDQGHQIFQ
jgi:hypothetical protein